MDDLELTQTEAEFFADGFALEQNDNDTFADLDTDMPRGVWDRIFHKHDAHERTGPCNQPCDHVTVRRTA